ncbi:unnamed protein product [Cuscuta campestris]|uniref:CRIB domain-containing protein n=1 Tax=Cuscuta campestris TaxID=132261 RepID=A0A484LYR4_9ASTE|nr:unnamed protein product [Cuscuta campestris]
MKGSFKAGFKYISNIFVVKDREIEIEIGVPTDVKHVAHIGWDGQAGNAPTWMNDFKAGPDFISPTIGNLGHGLSPWSSQELQSGSDFCNGTAQSREVPCGAKKQKRKKLRSSGSSASSRSTRSNKQKVKLAEDEPKPLTIEVATY